MKKLVLIILVALSFSACNNEQKGLQFKRMTNVDIGNLQKDNATFHATAVFFNQSTDTLTVKDFVLDFIVDGKDVGTIVIKSDKKLMPNSEASIPIKYSYETADIVKDGEQLTKTYSIKLNGDLTAINTKNNEVSSTVTYIESINFVSKKEEREEKRESRKEERQQKREERKAERKNN